MNAMHSCCFDVEHTIAVQKYQKKRKMHLHEVGLVVSDGKDVRLFYVAMQVRPGRRWMLECQLRRHGHVPAGCSRHYLEDTQ